MSPLDCFQAALSSRNNAKFALRSKLPGWRIYFKAEMRRAIAKWGQYAECARRGQLP